MCFDETLTARITDIGVHVRSGDGTYLGAIHIHEGMKPRNAFDCINNDVSLVTLISFFIDFGAIYISCIKLIIFISVYRYLKKILSENELQQERSHYFEY